MNHEGMNRSNRWIVGVLIGVLLGVALGLAVRGVAQSAGQEAEDAAVEQAKDLSTAFRTAARKVIPTVVKIRVASRPAAPEEIDDDEASPSPDGNPFKGTPLEDFFKDHEDFFGKRFPDFRMIPRLPRQGVGSGVIIDPSGVIVTNNHVVDGADEVIVELADGRELKATDIRTDPQTDLAVFRVKADSPLPAAKLGDSSKLEIGDWVLAIGCPFELDLTVSAGIISGKGRALAAGRRADYLQTDAAINPGNSGGPLVNLRGEVVGINTAIASNTGGYQGVGFAIPIDLAGWVAKQLVEKGKVERSYLGVGIEQIDGRLARKLGVEQSKGVLVAEVFPNTPAAEAGFHVGDVILSFDGQPVANPRELQEAVERTAPGSKHRVEALRDGQTIRLDVVVQALPGDFGLASRGRGLGEEEAESPTGGYRSKELGLEVGPLADDVAEKLGFEKNSGVLITRVVPGGLADMAGLGEGMLILRVGKKTVKSVADFKAAMEKESVAEGVLLLVRTKQGNRFIVLQKS